MPSKHQHKHSSETKKGIAWPQRKWHLKKHPERKGMFCHHGSWLLGDEYCVTCGRKT